MDTVVFDNKTYIKAADAAKNFKYAADYIGQLCRAGKVDARLLGRTWFVNPESLEGHKKNRKTGRPKKGRVPDTASDRALVRKKVPAVLTRTAAKSISAAPSTQPVSITAKTGVYAEDEESLLPALQKKSREVTEGDGSSRRLIRVEVAEAKPLKITNKTKESFLAPESMPEVALSGKLQVTEFEDAEVKKELPPTQKQSLDKITRQDSVLHNVLQNNAKKSTREEDLEPRVQPKNDTEHFNGKHHQNHDRALTKTSLASVDLTKNLQVRPASPQKHSKKLLFASLVLLFISCIGALFIVLLSSETIVNGSSIDKNVIFQTANIRTLFDL